MDIEALQAEEDQLRKQISQLSPEQKKHYYQLEKQQVKDPDTYAVLNWFVVAGLHHFYLGNYKRGAINVLLVLIGLALLHVWGWVLIILVFLAELPQLFFSQKIVYQHNNQVMKDLIAQVSGMSPNQASTSESEQAYSEQTSASHNKHIDP